MSETTDHPLERMVFFSDAVFAIAITLLVIEVHAPHLPHRSPDAAYLQALARLAPNIVGYLMSVAVIGAFRLGHHRVFSLAGRLAAGVVGWNLALLGAVAFIPFVTAFFSGNPLERVPTAVYWGWIMVAAVLNLRVNLLATSPAMLSGDADTERVVFVRLRGIGLLLGSLIAFALALVLPVLAPLGMVTGVLWRRLLAPAVRRRVTAARDRSAPQGAVPASA